MAGVSFPVSRSTGEAMIVASVAARAQAVATLNTLGIAASAFDDPYSAMAELCRRPMVFHAIILSLSGIYTEELEIIPAIKRRYPQMEVWVTHTDGRYSALAEAMRLGADGILADDGLHRIAAPAASRPVGAPPASSEPSIHPSEVQPTEPEPAESIEPKSNGHHSPAASPPFSEEAHADARERTVSTVPATSPSGPAGDGAFGEPVLTADELRALLQESPPTGADPEKGLI